MTLTNNRVAVRSVLAVGGIALMLTALVTGGSPASARDVPAIWNNNMEQQGHPFFWIFSYYESGLVI